MGKSMEKVNPGVRRTRHTKEFKLEAVKLLEQGQKSATQLALELGIKRNQLHKWQAALRDKGESNAFRSPGAKPLSEYAEVEMLRRELKRVTEERDILKKGRSVLCEGVAVKYAFIRDQSKRFPISALCRVLQVSRSEPTGSGLAIAHFYSTRPRILPKSMSFGLVAKQNRPGGMMLARLKATTLESLWVSLVRPLVSRSFSPNGNLGHRRQT